jgi:hypothetical protein
METEAGARSSGRPRPWLLGALGVAIAAYAYTLFAPGKSVAPPPAQSNAPRTVAPKAAKGGGPIDPVDLQVRLEDLNGPHPDADKAGRNPFKFYEPPPPPPPSPVTTPGAGGGGPPPPPPKPIETGPPPIPLKFIGVLQTKAGERIAAFSDCQKTWRGREGEVVAGQYRLLKIGVESVQMEYLDHKGQATIRMSGQDCIGR